MSTINGSFCFFFQYWFLGVTKKTTKKEVKTSEEIISIGMYFTLISIYTGGDILNNNRYKNFFQMYNS